MRILFLVDIFIVYASICENWCSKSIPMCSIVCGDIIDQSAAVRNLTESLSNTRYNLKSMEEMLLEQSVQHEYKYRIWKTQLLLADQNTTWTKKISILHDRFENCSSVLEATQLNCKKSSTIFKKTKKSRLFVVIGYIIGIVLIFWFC